MAHVFPASPAPSSPDVSPLTTPQIRFRRATLPLPSPRLFSVPSTPILVAWDSSEHADINEESSDGTSSHPPALPFGGFNLAPPSPFLIDPQQQSHDASMTAATPKLKSSEMKSPTMIPQLFRIMRTESSVPTSPSSVPHSRLSSPSLSPATPGNFSSIKPPSLRPADFGHGCPSEQITPFVLTPLATNSNSAITSPNEFNRNGSFGKEDSSDWNSNGLDLAGGGGDYFTLHPAGTGTGAGGDSHHPVGFGRRYTSPATDVVEDESRLPLPSPMSLEDPLVPFSIPIRRPQQRPQPQRQSASSYLNSASLGAKPDFDPTSSPLNPRSSRPFRRPVPSRNTSGSINHQSTSTSSKDFKPPDGSNLQLYLLTRRTSERSTVSTSSSLTETVDTPRGGIENNPSLTSKRGKRPTLRQDNGESSLDFFRNLELEAREEVPDQNDEEQQEETENEAQMVNNGCLNISPNISIPSDFARDRLSTPASSASGTMAATPSTLLSVEPSPLSLFGIGGRMNARQSEDDLPPFSAVSSAPLTDFDDMSSASMSRDGSGYGMKSGGGVDSAKLDEAILDARKSKADYFSPGKRDMLSPRSSEPFPHHEPAADAIQEPLSSYLFHPAGSSSHLATLNHPSPNDGGSTANTPESEEPFFKRTLRKCKSSKTVSSVIPSVPGLISQNSPPSPIGSKSIETSNSPSKVLPSSSSSVVSSGSSKKSLRKTKSSMEFGGGGEPWIGWNSPRLGEASLPIGKEKISV